MLILLAVLPPLLALAWSLRPPPAPERVKYDIVWERPIPTEKLLTPMLGTDVSRDEINRELRRIYETSQWDGD